METRPITLTLPEDVVRQAGAFAAERHTTAARGRCRSEGLPLQD